MKPRSIRVLILILSLAVTGSYLHAQVKYEKEYRIRAESVPAGAKAFVGALPFDRRIRWYREEGLESTSVEAKTRYKGRRYSVEFDNKGMIEDIEIEIPWADIPVVAQDQLCQYLEGAHEKFRIDKIQRQYTGDRELLIQSVNEQSPPAGVNIHYEVVVKALTDNRYQMLEYLFTKDGKMKSSSIILLRNTDNLEY